MAKELGEMRLRAYLEGVRTGHMAYRDEITVETLMREGEKFARTDSALANAPYFQVSQMIERLAEYTSNEKREEV